jgi:nucleoside-diphosphate-sugar epimerase
MHAAMRGCDAVFHAPERYEVGLPEREADAMDEANVRGTVNVLDAAAEVSATRTWRRREGRTS